MFNTNLFDTDTSELIRWQKLIVEECFIRLFESKHH